MTQRNNVIDYLRGVAMLAMILIHTTAYHLGTPISAFLWNYSQFAVQIFVFCSMYLFIKKNDFSKFTWNDLLTYYKKYIPKRFLRLVLPYYLFLPFYFFLQFLISGNLPPTSYILHSLTLTGGVDINWLVLLFLQVTFLSPLCLFIAQKFVYIKRLLVVFIISFLLLSIPVQIRSQFPDYRWIMSIGWMYYFFFTYNFIYPATALIKNVSKYTIILSIVAGILGVISPIFAHLYNQKYPPDIFFIIYGVIWITLLYEFFSRVTLPDFLKRILHFFSIYSYPLFFVHYLVLVFVSTSFKFNWYTFFFVVLVASAVVQSGYTLIKDNFVHTKK